MGGQFQFRGRVYPLPRSSARWPVLPGSAALPATPGGARCGGAGTDPATAYRDMPSGHEMEGIGGKGGQAIFTGGSCRKGLA
jgi:hypothetical protein